MALGLEAKCKELDDWVELMGGKVLRESKAGEVHIGSIFGVMCC